MEEILDHKIEDGDKYYLIRWKGYGSDGDTWQEESSITCPGLLKKYRKAHPDDKPIVEAKSRGRKRTHVKDKRRKATSEPKPKQLKIDELPGYEEVDEEDAEWEVEKILDVHFNKKDKTKDFLIRWKGYSSKSDSWEPEANLDCKELIEKYMDKVNRVTAVTLKELRVAPAHTQRFTLMGQAADRRLSKRLGQRQR